MKIKKLSVFTERMMPDFVHQDHQQFTKFVRYYFEYLEQNDGVYDYASNSLAYMDIDDAKESLLEEFQYQYLINFPDQTEVDVRFLVKHIREFYQSKSSEKSYEFLFRLLFDSEIDIYYPKLDILRCSDGKWNEANQDWDNTDGWLSSDKKLQDNYYYQDFSYEILSDVTRFYYENMVQEQVHPAGQLMFGRNVLDNPYPMSVSKFDYDTYAYDVVNVPAETAIWRGSPESVTTTEFNDHTIMIDVNGLYVEDSISGAYITIGGTYEPDDLVGMRRLGHALGDNFSAVGDGTTVAYDITDTLADKDIMVFVGGIKKVFNIDYVAAGSIITFTTAPGNLLDIKIIKHTSNARDLFSSTGTSKTLTLNIDPQGFNKEKVIVFANGKIVNPLSYDELTKQLTFKNYLPEGTNNIEIHYLDALEYTEHLSVLNLVLKYNIFTNYNKFDKLPESFRTVLIEPAGDTLLPMITEAFSLLVFVTPQDNLNVQILESSEILVFLNTSDTLSPRIDEFVTLLNLITTTDTIRPKITEVATLLSLVTPVDTIRPMITEGTTLLASTSDVIDTISPKITESSEVVQTTERTDISFTANSTISTVAGDFTLFDDTDTITVVTTSGTNDGTYTISGAPTTTTITISETTLTTESAATAGTVSIARTV